MPHVTDESLITFSMHGSFGIVTRAVTTVLNGPYFVWVR
jgi:hypothetical protein